MEINMKSEYKHPTAYAEMVYLKDIITLSLVQDGEGLKTSWEDSISLNGPEQ